MKKWYLCLVHIVGEEIKSKAAEYPASVQFEAGWIPTDPNTGLNVFSWTLVLMDTEHQLLVVNDPDIFELPGVTYETPMHDVAPEQIAVFEAGLAAMGISDLTWLGTDLFGTVVANLAQRLDPQFNTLQFPL